LDRHDKKTGTDHRQKELKLALQIRPLLKTAAALAAGVLTGLAQAQSYPAKAVTIVVLTAPGGIQSAVTRLIADQLTAKWGKPVIVENRPGAGGLIASEYVSKAAPDGYTLLNGTDAISTYAIFMKATHFDMEKDLSPISIATYSPFILQTNAKVPARTIKEFIAYAKANPGKLNAAVAGASQQMLDTVLFNQRAGTQIELIPYAGGAPALQALLANEVQFYFGGMGSASQFAAGTLIPLAVGGEQRFRKLPDVPTLKESGIDMQSGFWFGYLAPPATPLDLREKISSDMREAVHNPEVTKQITENVGMDVVGSTVSEMAARIAREVKTRSAVAVAARIEPK